MPADGFPDGWTLAFTSGGGVASITVPAAPGVAHVLDSFQAKAVSFDTTFAHSFNIQVTSSDGVLNTSVAFVSVNAAASAQVGTSDSASASGLNLAAGPGASVTITFGASATSVTEFLLIQGHDT